MSDETEKGADEEFRVSPLCLKFRLEWKISLKAFVDPDYGLREMPKGLKPPQMSSDLNFVENSKLFEFEDLKIRPFYLELYRHGEGYVLRVVTQQPSDGVKLDYAFASMKELRDQLFYIPVSSADNAPASVRGRKLTQVIVESCDPENYVKIVCGIRATSDAQFRGEAGPEEHVLVLESALAQGLPTLGDREWHSSIGAEVFRAVTRFSQSGELPCLSVSLAKDLLAYFSFNKSDHDVLKSFCVEHLMENLTPENVVSIWGFAGDHILGDLIYKCYKYVKENCILTKKKPNADDL